MRHFMRKLGQISPFFTLLTLVFDIGRAFCIFTPLSMFVKSSFIVFVVSVVVFLLDYPFPTFAWLAHLVIWLISIFSAAHCQDVAAFKLYLVCAVAYVLVEILCTGLIVIAGAKKSRC